MDRAEGELFNDTQWAAQGSVLCSRRFNINYGTLAITLRPNSHVTTNLSLWAEFWRNVRPWLVGEARLVLAVSLSLFLSLSYRAQFYLCNKNVLSKQSARKAELLLPLSTPATRQPDPSAVCWCHRGTNGCWPIQNHTKLPLWNQIIHPSNSGLLFQGWTGCKLAGSTFLFRQSYGVVHHNSVLPQTPYWGALQMIL